MIDEKDGFRRTLTKLTENYIPINLPIKEVNLSKL